MSDSSPPLDYASSGVDIEQETDAVSALVGALKGVAVRRPGEEGAPVGTHGDFSGLIEFGDRLLALATDGVGSKLVIAEELGWWETVGIDCMAMNVNDLICIGAEPIAFVDYIASPKPDPKVHAALGRSLAEAAKLARVTMCGGETASLPDLVTGLDLSGTALGWLPAGDQLTGESISLGDKLIGLPSNGIHSNGYSLVRKVIEKSHHKLTDPAPFPLDQTTRSIHRHTDPTERPTLGEVLLNPTRIYVDPVIPLLKSCKDGSGPAEYGSIHGMAHITGGGLSNLLRLHPTLGYHISDPFPALPEFCWMADQGGVNVWEMHRTFNMGLGMVIIVDADSAEQVTDWLAERLPNTKLIGEVVAGHQVTHKDPEIVFDHY